MLPFETLTAFTLAAVLLALAPGPDNLFVLTQSALNGAKNGIFVVLGLCTGLIVHTAAVAFGLAAVIQTSAVAFTVIKFIGAGYLLYLAWRAFRASGSSMAAAAENALGPLALFRRGIIMNVTNPKVAMFFLALFPQFMRDDAGPALQQAATLGVVFMVSTMIVFGAIALLAGGLRSWLIQSPSAQGVLNKIAGVVFVGLALKLAVSERT